MNVQIVKKMLAGAGVATLLTFPLFVFAVEATQTQIDVNTGKVTTTGITYECENGDCTYSDVLQAVDKLMTFGRDIALQFSVVIIAYAGFKYMISGDNPKERTEANAMFVKVLYGIFFVLAAWLIVHLVTNALLSKVAQDALPQGLR